MNKSYSGDFVSSAVVGFPLMTPKEIKMDMAGINNMTHKNKKE
jgi:hypothetical protein